MLYTTTVCHEKTRRVLSLYSILSDCCCPGDSWAHSTSRQPVSTLYSAQFIAVVWSLVPPWNSIVCCVCMCECVYIKLYVYCHFGSQLRGYSRRISLSRILARMRDVSLALRAYVKHGRPSRNSQVFLGASRERDARLLSSDKLRGRIEVEVKQMIKLFYRFGEDRFYCDRDGYSSFQPNE